jgi:uncharacterized protein
MSDTAAGDLEAPLSSAPEPPPGEGHGAPGDAPAPVDVAKSEVVDGADADAVAIDTGVVDEGGAGPTEVGEFKLALVTAVNVDLPNQHPTVILREIESPRRQLSFSIGLQDGVVLSHALRRIPTPRPLTHELLSSILIGFDIDVVAVRLVGRQGAVYFAELDLRGRTGRSVHSCRPSDALSVALLQPVPVPILIDRRLFEETGDVAPAGSGAPPD